MNNFKNNTGKFLSILSLILLGYLIFLLLFKPFLSNDEWFTQGMIYIPFWDMITTTSIDAHPPLYYIILRIFFKLITNFTDTFNPIIISSFISIIPLIILLIISFTEIRKEYGWITSGIFSFTIITMSEFFKFYLISRMYSWGLLFLVLIILIVKKILSEKNNTNYWIILSIFSILGAYTHYFVAISTIVLYLILFIHFFINNKTEIKKWIFSCVLNIIFYIPWITILFKQASVMKNNLQFEPVTLQTFLYSFGYSFTAITLVQLLFTAISVSILIIVIKHYCTNKNKDNFLMMSGVSVFCFTIILTTILSVIYKPVLILRYLIPAAGIFWLSLSILISKIENNKILLTVILLILIIGSVNIVASTHYINDAENFTNENIKLLNNLNNNDTTIIFTDYITHTSFSNKLNETNQISLNRDYSEIRDGLKHTDITQNISKYDNVYVIHFIDCEIDKDDFKKEHIQTIYYMNITKITPIY